MTHGVEKVATVRPCNMKAPDVTPVVLHFNYAAYNAPAYKFHTSATSLGFGMPDLLSGMDSLSTGSD